MTLSSKITEAATESDCGVGSEDLGADLQQHLAHDGIDLARHDGGTGLGGRQSKVLPDQGADRNREANVVGNFDQAHGDGFKDRAQPRR